jgi:hypothetical protein
MAMESYINDIRAARLLAGDFLAANPKQHVAIVQQGEISLVRDRAGHERVVPAGGCSFCEHDEAACDDAGACAMFRQETPQ